MNASAQLRLLQNLNKLPGGAYRMVSIKEADKALLAAESKITTRRLENEIKKSEEYSAKRKTSTN